MVIKSVNLETVCGITSTIPENIYNEVAFAGKSNVGKSSLINALMNRKALARTSAQPGKTQTINFYNVNDAMYLVDLPGYGYANANIEIKAKWGTMIENYLHTSKRLKGVFLLIDIRHDPSENDQLMYEWMVDQGFEPIIIATKADKISRGQIARHVKAIEEGLQALPGTRIIPFSAETKQGRDEIWELIDSLVLVNEEGLPLSEEEIELLLNPRMRKAASKATGAEGLDLLEEDFVKESLNKKQEQKENTQENPKKKERWKAQGKETGKRKAQQKARASKKNPSKKRK